MIFYDPGTWGVGFIFTLYGSVFPKSFIWGFASTLIAVVLKVYFPHDLQMDGMTGLWSGYTSVLGFLIVFRNGQAYSRFWEGAALIHQVRGEWFNACSSLVAFCAPEQEKNQQVVEFQHLLVRLMSMLHCAALQQIASVKDDCFEIIDPNGIDQRRLRYLSTMSVPDRTDILLQWIQRLVVEAEAAGTLKIAPPILSRVFQELSRGIVNLHNVKKIKDIPFPFPYAQMITVMMLVHFLVTPVMASQECGNWQWAALVTFSVVCSFWALLYISLEIEQPFGEDVNDLPVAEMQVELNHSLSLLLHKEAKSPPSFELQDLSLNVSNVDMNCFGIQTRHVVGRSLLGRAGVSARLSPIRPSFTMSRVSEGVDIPDRESNLESFGSNGSVGRSDRQDGEKPQPWKTTPFVSHTCFAVDRHPPGEESTDASTPAREDSPEADAPSPKRILQDARRELDCFVHDGIARPKSQRIASLPGIAESSDGVLE